MMTAACKRSLVLQLRGVVGARHVLTKAARQRSFNSGYRIGKGRSLAVVRPGNLIELWKVAEFCIEAGCVVIMQAANTGLTGGSTPFGDYDRHVVVINTMRLKGVHLLENGLQAICLPGATLFELDRALAPVGREPHSEIGSSCLGATVHGGICNNSGGALVQRGPAYTEAALYGRISQSGRLELVNHLGVDLGDAPEDILRTLESGNWDKSACIADGRVCSRTDYADHVRRANAETPARFNADPRNLFEASGCAGKLILFAVRVDTFPRTLAPKVFHVATNDPDQLTQVRRDLLEIRGRLPIAAEYLHQDIFMLAQTHGRDTFAAIRMLGTNRLPALFAAKSSVDRLFAALGLTNWQVSDRVLQLLGRMVPEQLPKSARQAGMAFSHHLLLKVEEQQVASTRQLLATRLAASSATVLEYNDTDGRKAFLHRFVAAGAAIRYDALHSRAATRLVALDIALRRNDVDWHTFLPTHLSERIEQALVYGHFLCNVLHIDLVVRRAEDVDLVKAKVLKWYAEKGAVYPAEHNVGHTYEAAPSLVGFYRALDPTNVLNPGIGQTSKSADWS